MGLSTVWLHQGLSPAALWSLMVGSLFYSLLAWHRLAHMSHPECCAESPEYEALEVQHTGQRCETFE